jgi:hypothetical protein
MLLYMIRKYGALSHFQQYFSDIMVVSFISGGNRSTRRRPLTSTICRRKCYGVVSICHGGMFMRFFFLNINKMNHNKNKSLITLTPFESPENQFRLLSDASDVSDVAVSYKKDKKEKTKKTKKNNKKTADYFDKPFSGFSKIIQTNYAL